MRDLKTLLLASVLCSTAPAAVEAQGPTRWTPQQAPVTLSMSLPTARPALTARGLLLQTGAGILGGIAAMLPVVYASAGSSMDEGPMMALVAGAYTAGTAAGIHYAGRAQGTSGSLWATGAGVVGGLVVSGAMMQPFIDEEENADGPAPLLVFVVPSLGGTAGYALTRRAR